MSVVLRLFGIVLARPQFSFVQAKTRVLGDFNFFQEISENSEIRVKETSFSEECI